jgi:phage shock protein PspC (stress-responsive transcriptional regulator)
MNETTDTSEQQPDPGGGAGTAPIGPPTPSRPPLRRSVADRKVAGVAGGLGRYFDIDPLIFRVVFVTLAIFGGSGLLLYAIGWLLIPEEGENESEAAQLVNGRPTSRVLGALVLGVVGLIAVGNFAHTGWGVGGFAALIAIAAAAYLISRGDAGWDSQQQPAGATPPGPAQGAYGQKPGTAYAAAPGPTATAGPPPPPTWNAPPAWTPPPPRPREPQSPLGRITVSLALLVAGLVVGWNIATVHDAPAEIVFASCLAVVGFGLVVSAFVGRARGLIVLGALLALASSVASVSHVGFRGGVGDRTWTPATVASAESHSPYRLGIGDAQLDLTRLDLANGQTVHVDVRLGVGDLTVLVPPGVTVDADADVRAGVLDLLANPSQDGTDLHEHVLDGPDPAAPVIVLDAEMGVGNLEVRRATS